MFPDYYVVRGPPRFSLFPSSALFPFLLAEIRASSAMSPVSTEESVLPLPDGSRAASPPMFLHSILHINFRVVLWGLVSYTFILTFLYTDGYVPFIFQLCMFLNTFASLIIDYCHTRLISSVLFWFYYWKKFFSSFLVFCWINAFELLCLGRFGNDEYISKILVVN